MKEYIKYIPLGLFVAFSLKSLVAGAVIQDAPVYAILAVFTAYLINRDEEKSLKNINDKLNQLEKLNEVKSKEIEELRSHVSTMKLGQQMRSAVKF
jgi:uncharacterized membrane protein YgaE (UPF0421/DUF939 family)